MILSGEMCKSCGTLCTRDFEQGGIVLECPLCDGHGCSECSEGTMELSQCPRQYIGGELTDAINAATLCEGGIWPVAGGLLDQSSWFVDLQQQLTRDTNRIKSEQFERARKNG